MLFVSRHRAGRLYSVKVLALSALAFSLLLSAHAARAQYSVTYSSSAGTGISVNGTFAAGYSTPWGNSAWPDGYGCGLATVATLGGGGIAQVAPVSPQGGQGATPDQAISPGGGSGGTISLGGTMTATLALAPGATAPGPVLVEQYCTVSWSGSGGTTGSCNNPLGPTTEYPGYPGGTRTYIKYTFLASPGAAAGGPYSCAPTATATFPSGGSGGVSVEYRVVVYPISLNITGPTTDPTDGSKNVLIGQFNQADLMVGATGCTQSDWQWSVSGTTFQTWQPTTPSVPGPANSQASYYVDGPGPLNIQNPSWYWNDPSKTTETVSCTATVTPPNGLGAPCTVAASQPVTVWLPSWFATATPGTMQIFPKPDGASTDYFIGAYPIPGYNGGMDVLANVYSPNTDLFGAGTIEMVQLDTVFATYWNGSDEYDWSQDGEFGLDRDFPQIWFHSPPNTTFYEWLDTPDLNLTKPGTGLPSADRATLSDGFQTYLMYLAPGSSQLVPLANFGWTLDGSATELNPGGWAAFGSGPVGSITPSGVTDFTGDNSFPMWTQVNNAANGTFIKQ